jgi:hypothetical protein
VPQFEQNRRPWVGSPHELQKFAVGPVSAISLFLLNLCTSRGAASVAVGAT